MYCVCYVKKNKREVKQWFETQEQAIAYYREHLAEMTYGYISDEEAAQTAEMVKNDYEEHIAEVRVELNDNIANIRRIMGL